MATPVFCCGFECGVTGTGTHWPTFGADASFNISTIRSGSRSIRLNPSASTGGFVTSMTFTSSGLWVIRCYIYFASLPTQISHLINPSNTTGAITFQNSDSKLYANANGTLGATGITVTTGQWYRLDIKIDQTANPITVDLSVNGVAAAQATNAAGSGTSTTIRLGHSIGTRSYDIYFDDIIISNASEDYPFGPGKVEHFVPTSDGTHNIAGANDYERTLTGTDILNSTTDAYLLIDDVPLETGAGTDWINMIAPTANSYVECIFGPAPGISTPTRGPRVIDIIAGIHQAGTGNGNMEIILNDNGSEGNIYTATDIPGVTTIAYKRFAYSNPPSAASEWTVIPGDGNFNDIRVRYGMHGIVDANPDQYLDCIMIEAEFQEIAAIPNKIVQVKQAVNRASTY